MVRAAVIGATGYAGAELVRILSGHPRARLSLLISRQHAGVSFSKIYPAMAGVVDLKCEALSEAAVAEASDVVFTALPHKASMDVVPAFIDRGNKVIDLSADFRFTDPALYEAWYEAHQAKDLLQTAVYGLPEIYFEAISKASLIGNPGCYPTSVLLPLLPFVKVPFVDLDDVVADSKSGASGAGRSVSLATHFCEVNESFKAYKVAEHRHNPEMDDVLSRLAERPVQITFTPHLVPMTRGILTTLYVGMKEYVSAEDIFACLHAFFAEKPFVRICAPGTFPDTRHVRGTNYCDIGAQIAARTRRLILVSAIDNLVKGASGQAVQNMNIMFGLPETAGLEQPSHPL